MWIQNLLFRYCHIVSLIHCILCRLHWDVAHYLSLVLLSNHFIIIIMSIILQNELSILVSSFGKCIFRTVTGDHWAWVSVWFEQKFIHLFPINAGIERSNTNKWELYFICKLYCVLQWVDSSRCRARRSLSFTIAEKNYNTINIWFQSIPVWILHT